MRIVMANTRLDAQCIVEHHSMLCGYMPEDWVFIPINQQQQQLAMASGNPMGALADVMDQHLVCAVHNAQARMFQHTIVAQSSMNSYVVVRDPTGPTGVHVFNPRTPI